MKRPEALPKDPEIWWILFIPYLAFHALFGLSLMGEEQIKPVSSDFCTPDEVLERVNAQSELLS